MPHELRAAAIDTKIYLDFTGREALPFFETRSGACFSASSGFDIRISLTVPASAEQRSLEGACRVGLSDAVFGNSHSIRLAEEAVRRGEPRLLLKLRLQENGASL
jgi:hypothetical protein